MEPLLLHLIVWGSFFLFGALFGFLMGWAFILSGKMRF